MKIVFHRMLLSFKSHFLSKDIFHWCLLSKVSLIKSLLLSKVVFHRKLSSLEECLWSSSAIESLLYITLCPLKAYFNTIPLCPIIYEKCLLYECIALYEYFILYDIFGPKINFGQKALRAKKATANNYTCKISHP